MPQQRGYDEIHPIFDEIPDDHVLHPEQIAEFLNFHPETVRRWCRKGKLPSYTFGNKYVIMGDDFKEYMKQARIKPYWIQKLEA